MKTMNKLFLMLLATTALVACDKKETTENEEEVRLVSKIVVIYSDEDSELKEEMQFSYDNQNRLTNLKMTDRDGLKEREKYSWRYEADAVIFTRDYSDNVGNIAITGTYKLNADGTVKSMDGNTVKTMVGKEPDNYMFTGTYTYENGFLSKSREVNEFYFSIESICTFFWEENNIIKEEEEEENSKSTTEYKYEGVYNKKCNIDLINLVRHYNAFTELSINFGKRSQGLLVEKTDSGEKYSYTYEYDSKGYITKIIEKHDLNLDLYTLTITYKD